MKTNSGSSNLSDSPAAQPVCPSVLTPAEVIQTYDDVRWEEFTLEYLGAEQPAYAFIEPKGGAGDKGRDIVAHTVAPPASGPVDIFQCKAYEAALTPSSIWVELGKLCVFTHRGDYPVPRKYMFMAPHGVGTKLGDLLKKPVELRRQLISNWPTHCEGKISASEKFPLSGSLKFFVESFDFSRVGYVPVHDLLAQHRRTPHWHQRFKRDYPIRPEAEPPSTTPQPHELRYIEQLFAAYGDHLKIPIKDMAGLSAQPILAEHLHRSRTDFFMADSLNRFYRDQFPGGAFEHVKKQVLDGVVEVAESDHADGLARVRATVQSAIALTLSKTDYTPYIEPGDKKGVCHHLANDDKLKWVKK